MKTWRNDQADDEIIPSQERIQTIADNADMGNGAIFFSNTNSWKNIGGSFYSLYRRKQKLGE
jgi:hypothetical protein